MKDVGHYLRKMKTKGVIEMRNLTYIKLIAIVFLVLSLTSHDAFAKGAKATITVSATVVECIEIDVQYQAGNIKVTADDIKRGYIDVYDGTVYWIKTNNREGYFLSFNNWSGIYKNVLVIVDGKSVALPDGCGFIQMQYLGGTLGETKQISYKLYLADNTEPGIYQWPLKIVVDSVISCAY